MRYFAMAGLVLLGLLPACNQADHTETTKTAQITGPEPTLAAPEASPGAGTDPVAASDTGSVGPAAATAQAAGYPDNDGWNIPAGLPTLRYSEMKRRGSAVRGNASYVVYRVSETQLFPAGAATLKAGAEQHLRQIAASINQRFPRIQVRVYDFPDEAERKDPATRGLGEQRANAVRSWLQQSGRIDAARVTIAPIEGNATKAQAGGEAAMTPRIEVAVRVKK